MHDLTRPAPWTSVSFPQRADKPARYAELAGDLDALLAGEPDCVANAANAAAAIYHALGESELGGILLPARRRTGAWDPSRAAPPVCASPLGKGVCGTAAAERRSLLVPDVERVSRPHRLRHGVTFRTGGAAADIGDDLLGVLDLDSPVLARFDEADLTGCEMLARVMVRHLAP